MKGISFFFHWRVFKIKSKWILSQNLIFDYTIPVSDLELSYFSLIWKIRVVFFSLKFGWILSWTSFKVQCRQILFIFLVPLHFLPALHLLFFFFSYTWGSFWPAKCHICQNAEHTLFKNKRGFNKWYWKNRTSTCQKKKNASRHRSSTLYNNYLKMDHRAKRKMRNCKTPRIQHRKKPRSSWAWHDFF